MNVTESEDQAQRLIFDWARWQQGKYPQLKAMYHAANEGKRSARAGAELKRQGMKPGVSDICLPYASGKYNNLYGSFMAIPIGSCPICIATRINCGETPNISAASAGFMLFSLNLSRLSM